ncbi:hypothetical protein ACFL20_03780 [Spirochaetota bacterium]
MDLNKLKDKLTWHKAEKDTRYKTGMVVKTEEGLMLVGDVTGYDTEVESIGCGRCGNTLVPTEYAYIEELFSK